MHGRSVATGLTGTLQGFFWAVGGLSVLVIISALIGLGHLAEYEGAEPRSRARTRVLDDMTATDEAINGLIGFAWLGGLVVFILIIIWTYQAHQATQRLYRGPRKWSSGWTIGGWFIPVANALIPKLVLNEIERIALTPRVAGVPSEDWRRRPTLAGGWIWWVAYVVGVTVATMGSGSFDEPGGSVDTWRAGYWLVVAGHALLATSAVFGALYIRRIGRELSAQRMDPLASASESRPVQFMP
jgi:hypothetical protein